MTSLEMIPGAHICGKKLENRRFSVDNDNGSVEAWIIYGVCKKCNIVLITGLFIQEIEPILDVDYMIDEKMIAKGAKPFTVENVEKEVKAYGNRNR